MEKQHFHVRFDFYGLIGGPTAKKRREKLGERLKIGYANGKQLMKRLAMFHITKEAFLEAIEAILKEEEADGKRNSNVKPNETNS